MKVFDTKLIAVLERYTNTAVSTLQSSLLKLFVMDLRQGRAKELSLGDSISHFLEISFRFVSSSLISFQRFGILE